MDRLQRGSRSAVETMQQGSDQVGSSVEQATQAGRLLASINDSMDVVAQQIAGGYADHQVGGDGFLVKLVRLAGHFDLAMERLVGNAKQRSIGYAEPETVGRNRGCADRWRRRVAAGVVRDALTREGRDVVTYSIFQAIRIAVE